MLVGEDFTLAIVGFHRSRLKVTPTGTHRNQLFVELIMSLAYHKALRLINSNLVLGTTKKIIEPCGRGKGDRPSRPCERYFQARMVMACQTIV